MFYTKCVLYATVVSTMACGVWVDRSVPYFPIEISRTATGPLSRRLFPAGAALALLVATTEAPNYRALWPFIGLLLLAAVPDDVSWPVHMIGVALMVLGCCAAISDMRGVVVFAALLGVYAFRLVLKAAVLLPVMDNPADILHYGAGIMFGTREAHGATAIAFKLGAVLQWVVLYGLLECVNLGDQ